MYYIACLILFLRVRDVSIFPTVDKNYIKLGSVVYERKDFVRGFLVGISPLFGAFMVFYGISAFHIFPSQNIFISGALAYIIFTLSSTMFSSRQDLVDFLSMIPLLLLIFGILYLFGPNISIPPVLSTRIIELIQIINRYLFISLIINMGIVLFLHIGIGLIKR